MIEPTPELKTDFLNWLETGFFRGIRPNMTRAECVEKLGPYQDWGGGSSERRAGIYKWSDLEFHFINSKYPSDNTKDPLFLIFTDWASTIAALFGYGYDCHRQVGLVDLIKLLVVIDPEIKKCLIKADYLEVRTIKLFWREDFQFYAVGEPGSEVVTVIEQNPDLKDQRFLEEL